MHTNPSRTRTAGRHLRRRIAGLALILTVIAAGCGVAADEIVEPFEPSSPSTQVEGADSAPIVEPAAAVAEAPTSAPVTEALTSAPDTEAPTSADPESAPTADSAPWRAVSRLDVIDVVAAPGSGEVVASLDAVTSFGSARVFLVESIRDDWVEVHLPVRPNGAIGWVPASAVDLERLDTFVRVDLEARELTVWVDGTVDRVETVAVGTGENPTPTGRFFITDKLDTGDDGGAYGPYALGLSAHSDTLSEFGGGNGQIGLHGTNDPATLGDAVSHGCVRLPNDVIAELAHELPLGTPVEIV